MPRLATERITRGLRWSGGALLIGGGLVVMTGIAFTRSIDALIAAASIAALALGLPGATAFFLAMWLEHIAERSERPLDAAAAAAARPNPFREPFTGYAIAVAAVLAAWGLREALDPYLAGQVPFITFFLAVAVAAWAGGFGPAAFATLICLVISGYYYVAPVLRPGAGDIARFVVLGVFTLVCLGIAAIMATLREALARTRQLVDEMPRRGEPHAGGDNPLRALAQSAPVPLYMADRALACTYCNKAWLAWRGRTLTQELGHGWYDGVHPQDLARLREARHAALAAERPAVVAYRLRLADGEFALVSESIDVCRGARGEIVGLVGACQERADTALRE